MIKNISEVDSNKIAEMARRFSDYQGKASIMFDCEDGAIWVDGFDGPEDFCAYDSSTIHYVYSKGSLDSGARISAIRLSNILAEFLKNGFNDEITDDEEKAFENAYSDK